MKSLPSFQTKNLPRHSPARRRMAKEHRTPLSLVAGNRCGYALIELLIVITILTAVISLTGATFYLLMRSETMVTQSFVTERAISRLAVQFRDDVHQSESGIVILDAANSPNELALGDASGVRIRYRVTKQGLVRLLVKGDAIMARDDFRLPDCAVRLTTGNESEPSLRTLVIERPGATISKHSRAPRPRRALSIQAYLNRTRPVTFEVASAKSEDNSTSPQAEKEERR